MSLHSSSHTNVSAFLIISTIEYMMSTGNFHFFWEVCDHSDSAISDIIAYEDITCSMIGGGRWLYGRITDYTNRKLVSVFLLSKIEDSIATFIDYSINSSGSEDGAFSIRTGNSTATTGMKVRALTIRK